MREQATQTGICHKGGEGSSTTDLWSSYFVLIVQSWKPLKVLGIPALYLE